MSASCIDAVFNSLISFIDLATADHAALQNHAHDILLSDRPRNV